MLLVRHADPAPVTEALDRAFRGIWPDLHLSFVGSITDLIERQLRQDVLRKRWLIGIAVLVVLFAATALAAHLSSVVTRRLPELAVMRALGARRMNLLRSLLRGSARVLLVGAIVFVPVSLQVQRALWPTLGSPELASAVIAGMAAAILIVLACSALAAMSVRDERLTDLLRRDSF